MAFSRAGPAAGLLLALLAPDCSQAQPDAALRALLAASGERPPAGSGCDGGGLTAATTLGEDLAAHLAALESHGRVEARCEGEACEVVVGREAGELVWSRHYRFRLAPGEAELSDPTCFTLP